METYKKYLAENVNESGGYSWAIVTLEDELSKIGFKRVGHVRMAKKLSNTDIKHTKDLVDAINILDKSKLQVKVYPKSGSVDIV